MTCSIVEVVTTADVTVKNSVLVTYEEQLPTPLCLACSIASRAVIDAVGDVLVDVGGGL